jgi:hypothetical protein
MGVIHGIIFAYSIYRVFAEQRNPAFPECDQNVVFIEFIRVQKHIQRRVLYVAHQRRCDTHFSRHTTVRIPPHKPTATVRRSRRSTNTLYMSVIFCAHVHRRLTSAAWSPQFKPFWRHHKLAVFRGMWPRRLTVHHTTAYHFPRLQEL